jgi:hypothetical protein
LDAEKKEHATIALGFISQLIPMAQGSFPNEDIQVGKFLHLQSQLSTALRLLLERLEVGVA